MRLFAFDIDFPLLDSFRKRRPQPPPELKDLTIAELKKLCESSRIFALSLTKSAPESERISQETIKLLYKKRRWKPHLGPLTPHVLAIVASIVLDERRDFAKEAAAHDELEAEMANAAAPSPEELAIEREHLADAEDTVRELFTALARDRIATALLHARINGSEKPEQVAKRLGVDVRRVYQALDTINYWTDKILTKKAKVSDENGQ